LDLLPPNVIDWSLLAPAVLLMDIAVWSNFLSAVSIFAVASTLFPAPSIRTTFGPSSFSVYCPGLSCVEPAWQASED